MAVPSAISGVCSIFSKSIFKSSSDVSASADSLSLVLSISSSISSVLPGESKGSSSSSIFSSLIDLRSLIVFKKSKEAF